MSKTKIKLQIKVKINKRLDVPDDYCYICRIAVPVFPVPGKQLQSDE